MARNLVRRWAAWCEPGDLSPIVGKRHAGQPTARTAMRAMSQETTPTRTAIDFAVAAYREDGVWQRRSAAADA